MANGCNSITESRSALRRATAGPHFTAAEADDSSTVDAAHDPACWGLSIGAAGMLSQMRGLSEAVGLRFEEKTTRLRRQCGWLPMFLMPRAAWAIQDGDLLNSPDPPRLVIACGRHGVIPLICCKQKWGERVFTVFIQAPRVDSSNFDLVVAPEHDGISGANVISTRGALHHLNADVLQAARETELAAGISQSGRPLVAVLLGGPNRYYGFHSRDVGRLIENLQSIAARDGAKLLIIPSRRTPAPVCARFQEEFGDGHFVWNGATGNPYLAALSVCDHVVVTGDSVSMTTEATATGRPVHVAHLSERLPARRFRRFHESFVRAGITRSFEGRLPTWTYTPPDDTSAVAARIRKRIELPCR